MNSNSFVSVSDARRAITGRIDDQSTQDQTVSGRNLFNELGKVFFEVKFPVVFCNRPVHGAGSELDPQTPFVALGAPIPPQATSMVVAWQSFGEIVGAFEGYYTGATIMAVIQGSKEQYTWIDWSFHGPALRNPLLSVESIVL